MKITTTCKTKKSIFRFSKMALNHVLIAPEYSRRRELQESYLNIFYLPIFDRFMAHQSSKKNFGPNVRYCFLGYIFALSFWSTKNRLPSNALALSLCQFTNFSLYNHIIFQVPKGCGRNFGDGPSDHDTRSQGLKGNAHMRLR